MRLPSKSPYSEETAKLIDEEVRKLVEECYQKAKHTLMLNKDELVRLAELLLKKEVVFRDEIEMILGKRGENAKRIAIFSRQPMP
ncbi:MAG TPA: hypothetical protein VGD40_26405 [Chryseosolibacter sp.]